MGAYRIGPYQVVSKLGEGGMGVVFEAQHSSLGRRAAVKVLHAEQSGNHAAVQRFFNEAKAAATIEHPGIITVYEFGFDGNTGSAYIAMELLRGETLRQRLDRQPALAESDVLRIGRGIATALAAAHHAGIVHRDLKPDNVFLVPDPDVVGGERVKLLDFGIAKLGDHLRQKGHTTKSGVFMGTPAYASPEQCDGAKALGPPSDLYGLGCILYHCVCGRPPFVADGVGRIIASHLSEKPNAPTLYAPNLSPGFADLLLQLLAKAPDARPGDASAVAEQLGQLGVSGSHTPQPVFDRNPHPARGVVPTTLSAAVRGSPPTSTDTSKRGWLIAAGLAVLVAVGASVVAIVGDGSGSAAVSADASTLTASATDASSTPTASRPTSRPALVADAAAAFDAGVVDARVKKVASTLRRCRFNNLVDVRTKRELRATLRRVEGCKEVLGKTRYDQLRRTLLDELAATAKPSSAPPKPL